jgi:hypothetical protein
MFKIQFFLKLGHKSYFSRKDMKNNNKKKEQRTKDKNRSKAWELTEYNKKIEN